MLDCETEKGKVFIKSEDETANFIEQYLCEGKTRLIKFAAKTSSADRFAVSNKTHRKQALIEIKSRQLTKKTLETKFNNEYLISEDKIKRCLKIAKDNKVPLFLFVNMMDDDYIIRVQISNAKGEVIARHRIVNKTTQKTCNGGVKDDVVYLFKITQPHSYFISKSQIIGNAI